jgi:hypothetical protein
MLTTGEHLKQTQEALACLERAMASIHRDREKMHPEWYRIMAGPVAEDILKLRAQIDEFIGLHDPLLAEELTESNSNGDSNGAAFESKPAPHESST